MALRSCQLRYDARNLEIIVTLICPYQQTHKECKFVIDEPSDAEDGEGTQLVTVFANKLAGFKSIKSDRKTFSVEFTLFSLIFLLPLELSMCFLC